VAAGRVWGHVGVSRVPGPEWLIGTSWDTLGGGDIRGQLYTSGEWLDGANCPGTDEVVRQAGESSTYVVVLGH
jgi:hypothetical protein